jgi:hypothetical protein
MSDDGWMSYDWWTSVGAMALRNTTVGLCWSQKMVSSCTARRTIWLQDLVLCIMPTMILVSIKRAWPMMLADDDDDRVGEEDQDDDNIMLVSARIGII